MPLLIALTRTVERLRFVRRIDRISINKHNWQSEHHLFLFTVRGVAGIFSEVRTILQITLHSHPSPTKKLPWLKVWLRRKPKSIDWCMSIIYHLYSLRIHRLLSCNKATYFSGFVTLFFDTVSISSFLSRCSASLSTDPLFSFRSLSSARDKTIKTAGYLLTASAGGRGGGRRFFEKIEKKNKTTSVYRLMQRVNPN